MGRAGQAAPIVIPANAGCSGWTTGQLLRGGGLDQLGDPRDVARPRRDEPEAERLRVRDHVEHPAVRDVDDDRADVRDLDGDVEVGRERGHVAERHPGDLAVRAVRADPDEAGRRLEDQLGDRLGHRQHPGLEQRGDHADRVRAGHAGYSTCSMITKPASASGWVGGRITLAHKAG